MSVRPRIKSTFGILDVEQGRKALAKYLAANAGLPVVIHAVLTEPHGHDDGTSIEFNMEVLRVTVLSPPSDSSETSGYDVGGGR